MKKHVLLGLLAFPLLATAQFFENFDSGISIPSGWTVINGGDANTFIISSGSPGSAYSSPNAAQINYSTAAHDDYLITPSITVKAGISDRLTYYVKNQDANYVENYAVKLSKTTPTAAAFTTTLKASAGAPNDWTQFSIDLTPYIGETIYIGFHATSADKFRLLFDDIENDSAPVNVPGCTTLSYPADTSTGISPNGEILKWIAPSTGGKVEKYDLYLDTKENPTTLVPTTGPTSAKVDNLLPNTTYYWKVIAKNAAGEAVGCAVYSFKTKQGLAPYCYTGLRFGSNISPITSVSLGDMTNTSTDVLGDAFPRENFIEKVIRVEQGKTYPIAFKGNTMGNFTDRYLVFADWDQNNSFTDAGEQYFGTSSTVVSIVNSTGVDTKTAQGNLAVPTTAKLGTTRLRVKKNRGTTFFLSPCYSSGTTLTATSGDMETGQVEDYTIEVYAPGTLAALETKSVAISVYPNPTKDVLNIASNEKKVISASFYSTDGKLVKSVVGSTSININDLSAGVYIVKIKTSDNEEKTFKVIKQ